MQSWAPQGGWQRIPNRELLLCRIATPCQAWVLVCQAFRALAVPTFFPLLLLFCSAKGHTTSGRIQLRLWGNNRRGTCWRVGFYLAPTWAATMATVIAAVCSHAYQLWIGTLHRPLLPPWSAGNGNSSPPSLLPDRSFPLVSRGVRLIGRTWDPGCCSSRKGGCGFVRLLSWGDRAYHIEITPKCKKATPLLKGRPATSHVPPCGVLTGQCPWRLRIQATCSSRLCVSHVSLSSKYVPLFLFFDFYTVNGLHHFSYKCFSFLFNKAPFIPEALSAVRAASTSEGWGWRGPSDQTAWAQSLLCCLLTQ